MFRLKVFLLILLLSSGSLVAVSYQQMETEHTRIIFEEDDLTYARQLSVFADEVFEQLALFLAHTPSVKVPVVITSNTAFANGYYINFPSAVYLYVTSPEDRFLGSRTQDWLKSLFIHELTHYIHLTAPVGPAKFLRFLGPGVTAMSTVFMPGWWIEGITTYAETAFVEHGGRGDSLPFARIYQASLAQDSMWSLSQGAYNGPFNPSNRIYVTGYLMVDYLVRKYGSSAYADINRRFAAFPFFGLSPAFKKVTGHSANELFTLALQEAQAIEQSSEHLFGEPMQGDRYLPSPTSIGLVGYIQSPYEGRALYRYSADGSAEKLMDLSLDGGSCISFATDTAVFSSVWADTSDPSSLALSAVSYSDLFLLNLSTLKAKRLTKAQRLVQPAISSDGSRIVASRVNGSFYDLVEVKTDTMEVITLASKERVSFLEPVLNRDGSKLAYLALESGNSSLYLLEEGKEPLLLVGPTADELRAPSFEEDDSILFVKELELYRINCATGRIQLVHTDSVGVYSAAVQADELFYETYTAQGFAVKKTVLQSSFDSPISLRDPLSVASYDETVSYQPSPYYDNLQFNLALPFPFVEANQFQMGIWFHATSLLRRHSLVGSVGWSIRGAKLLADLNYQYDASTYALALGLVLNQYDITTDLYVSSAYAAAVVPLFSWTGYSHFRGLSIKPQISLIWDSTGLTTTGSAMLGYTRQNRNSRTMDFFGPAGFASSGGVMLQSGMNAPILFGSVGMQMRLFDSSAMVRFVLDAIGTSSANMGNYYALFSFKPLQSGSGKLRLSTSIRLPLGLFDAPIPYGGLTGAGLEITAQSAWYVNADTLIWEGAWAAAARLTANMVLGGPAVAFQPFAELAYLFGPGKWQFSLGLDGQSLKTFLAIK
ncbi:MAG: hypothetical protein VB088_06700 [Sphaerochaeta sp.]|jgi:hypothetical protein|nr:hypothetical protein [Sphaerochaeta sp.]